MAEQTARSGQVVDPGVGRLFLYQPDALVAVGAGAIGFAGADHAAVGCLKVEVILAIGRIQPLVAGIIGRIGLYRGDAVLAAAL